MRSNALIVLVEKVIATYLQSFVAFLLVGETIDASIAESAAVAAIPAALTVVANGLPTVPPDLPFWVDLVLRTVRTYVVTFVGLIVADPVFSLDISVAAAAATGAIPAALALLKAGLASKVGYDDTAALLPAELDVPNRSSHLPSGAHNA